MIKHPHSLSRASKRRQRIWSFLLLHTAQQPVGIVKINQINLMDSFPNPTHFLNSSEPFFSPHVLCSACRENTNTLSSTSPLHMVTPTQSTILPLYLTPLPYSPPTILTRTVYLTHAYLSQSVPPPLVARDFPRLPEIDISVESDYYYYKYKYWFPEMKDEDVPRFYRCPETRNYLIDQFYSTQWADVRPHDEIVSHRPGFSPETTQAFCAANGVDLVVRGHEVCDTGAAFQHGNRTLTVFTYLTCPPRFGENISIGTVFLIQFQPSSLILRHLMQSLSPSSPHTLASILALFPRSSSAILRSAGERFLAIADQTTFRRRKWFDVMTRVLRGPSFLNSRDSQEMCRRLTNPSTFPSLYTTHANLHPKHHFPIPPMAFAAEPESSTVEQQASPTTHPYAPRPNSPSPSSIATSPPLVYPPPGPLVLPAPLLTVNVITLEPPRHADRSVSPEGYFPVYRQLSGQ